MKLLQYILIGCVAYSGIYLYEKYTTPYQVQVDKKELVALNSQSAGERRYDALVRIKDSTGMCSGTVISDNYILTAAHCVVDKNEFLKKTELSVYNLHNEDTGVKGIPVAVDIVRDIALVKGDFSEFDVALIDTRHVPSVGMRLVSCGFPADGNALCVPEQLVGNQIFQYRAEGTLIFQGMSGGPVLAPTQEGGMVIIGVNCAVSGSGGVLFGPIVAMESLWKLPEN